MVSGQVRVVDLLFVYKDADGTVGSLELAGLGADLEPAFVDLDGQLGGGLLDADDVEDVASGIEPGNSVAVIAVENLWAIPFIARGTRAAFSSTSSACLGRRGPPSGRPSRATEEETTEWDSYVGWRTAVVAGTATAVSNRLPAPSRAVAARDRQERQYAQQAPPAYAGTGTGGSTAAGRRRHDGRAGTARRPAEPGRAHRRRVRGGQGQALGL